MNLADRLEQAAEAAEPPTRNDGPAGANDAEPQQQEMAEASHVATDDQVGKAVIDDKMTAVNDKKTLRTIAEVATTLATGATAAPVDREPTSTVDNNKIRGIATTARAATADREVEKGTTLKNRRTTVGATRTPAATVEAAPVDREASLRMVENSEAAKQTLGTTIKCALADHKSSAKLGNNAGGPMELTSVDSTVQAFDATSNLGGDSLSPPASFIFVAQVFDAPNIAFTNSAAGTSTHDVPQASNASDSNATGRHDVPSVADVLSNRDQAGGDNDAAKSVSAEANGTGQPENIAPEEQDVATACTVHDGEGSGHDVAVNHVVLDTAQGILLTMDSSIPSSLAAIVSTELDEANLSKSEKESINAVRALAVEARSEVLRHMLDHCRNEHQPERATGCNASTYGEET